MLIRNPPKNAKKRFGIVAEEKGTGPYNITSFFPVPYVPKLNPARPRYFNWSGLIRITL